MAKKMAKQAPTTFSSPAAPHFDAQNVLPVASASRDQVQRAALLASVTGRPFEDVKFFAFSRHNRNGNVDKPLPLLANSALIRKASSHFDFVFGAGFLESGITDIDAPYPLTRPSSTDMYDYSSDSDLEDEEDSESDIPSAHDVSVKDHMGVKDTEDKSEVVMEDTSEGLNGIVLSGQNRGHARQGRVVFLGDIAYATWKAFIFYAYYEEFNFAPLKSQQQGRPKEQDPYKAPFCSPKSMYRIAHKYDIAALKEKASNDIKSKLSPGNILEEIFSTFTSLYPEIKTIELEYLQNNIRDAGIQARLPTWFEGMQDGRLPNGAGGILAELVLRLAPGAQPGLKRCPQGCTGNYFCRGCSRDF